ncbi:MAG TPA: ribonuclease H [Candidatus Saccharibacteria bacterium]|jgi:ribonuclease HI|nr:ribonuclease H [Candidatus Saccharibacteria bacterium]HMT55677.1 ribonuclease H [Candidatus Saccharibacteria bacterium]
MRIFYTDGSCSPNPGPGGYAVVEQGKPVALGSEKQSTNIRMEASALIAAMKLAGNEACTIHTDSEFWINVITKWAKGWEVKGWKKSTKGEIQNLDLVQEAYRLYQQGNVTLIWVRAHVGTDGNELADQWANKARQGATL